jgi:N utilization substance protein A
VTVLEGQEKHLEVIVDDSQLSLAIGKKGQNVRLAAKLLGWKIDIKSEEEKRQEVEEQMRGVLNQQSTPLETVPDLEPGIIEKLVAAGITTVESVADMTPEQLEEVPGIGPKTVEKISIAVNNYFASLDAAADGLPDAGEAVGEDVSAEEEARELEATEGGESVESEEAAGEAPEEVAAAERDDAETDVEQLAGDTDVEPGDEGGQAGDEEGLSDEPESSSESVEELADEGQAFEAEVIDGVENAPLADEGERIIRERIETPNETVSDEEEPGEQR